MPAILSTCSCWMVIRFRDSRCRRTRNFYRLHLFQRYYDAELMNSFFFFDHRCRQHRTSTIGPYYI